MPTTPPPHNAAGINHASRGYGDFGLIVKDLSVARGGATVAEGVNFALGAGDWLELRGPNGGGKTSLLRCLAGLSTPAAGAVEWREGGERAPNARGRCAWLGHLDGLQPFFTVRETLAFWAGAHADVEAAAAALGLTRFLDVKARTLSAGWRRRTALARLMLLGRPLWLVDEPFANLDERGCGLAEAMFAAHRARGGAVIAATHGTGPALMPGRILRLETV